MTLENIIAAVIQLGALPCSCQYVPHKFWTTCCGNVSARDINVSQELQHSESLRSSSTNSRTYFRITYIYIPSPTTLTY